MRKSNHAFIYFLSCFLVIIGVTFTSCSKKGDNVPLPGATTAYYLFVNMETYSDSVALFLNNTQATGQINTGGFSSSYAPLPFGNYLAQVIEVTTDSILATGTSSLYDSSGFYTVLLYNINSSGPLSVFKITDDFKNGPKDSSVYRFFNLSPDMPAVDFYLSTNKIQSNRATADNITNTNLNIFQSYLPGTYNLTAKKTGTDSVLVTQNNITLYPATAYTFILEESKTSTGNNFNIGIIGVTY
jgi:hypothetical protein